MWITKTKNGKYRMFERFPTYGRKYKTLSVLMEKDNAQTRKAALKELNRRAERLTVQDVSLSTLATAYEEALQATNRPQSVKYTKSRLNTILRLLGADMMVSELTAGYIRRQVLAEDKPDTWKNNLMKRIKALINWAYRNDYLENKKAADKLQLIPGTDRNRRENLENKFLSGDELRILLDGMENRKWKLAAQFLALTGMRFGEFSALLPEDFLPSGEIQITKTFSQTAGRDNPPKTASSYRRIFIQPELAECIRQINAYTAELRLSRPAVRAVPYWFPNPRGITKDGGHISIFAFGAYLDKISPGLIGKRITPHIFRHTHASLLFEKGLSIEQVSRRLGHSSGSEITRKIYVHITDKLKQQDNERLSRISIL